MKWLFIIFLCACSIKKSSSPPKKYEKVFKGHDEKDFNAFNKLIMPIMPKRLKGVYNHSMLKPLREQQDCTEDYCPKIDIWKYEYIYKNNLIESLEPISSKKAYWKNKKEARIIAITLFGEQKLYYDLLLEYLESMKWVSKVNGFEDQNWGFESFTVRVYIAKRNPKFLHLGPLKGEVSKEYIDILLQNGCEVAYVDNHVDKVGVDAFYWRFLVVNEPIKKGESIRYLIRDADWKAQSLELYALAKWISKTENESFFRFQPYEACIVAVTGSLWGGKHEGENFLFPNIKESIMDFPYRSEYGDDELYLHYILWPFMKQHKTIHSYIYSLSRNNLKFFFGNPFKNSCEEPTIEYCQEYGNNKCFDHMIPKNIPFPGVPIGLRKPFNSYKNEKRYFNFGNFRKNKDNLNRVLENLK